MALQATQHEIVSKQKQNIEKFVGVDILQLFKLICIDMIIFNLLIN